MGDAALIGLLYLMPKKHPLLIKRIGTACLDHVPGRADRFMLFRCALDYALRSLK